VIVEGQIALDWRDDTFRLRVYDHSLPVAVRAWPMLLGRMLDWAQSERGANPGTVAELTQELSECERVAAAPEPANAHESATRRNVEYGVRERFAAWVKATPHAKRWVARLLEEYRGDPGLPRVQRLLEAQYYRLAFWRNAAYAINYRRFFDINDLAALRVEIPRVFTAVHETVLRLIREGVVSGLRVDHPDGLYDPAQYFRRLQDSCASAARVAPKGLGLRIPDESAPFLIVAEKILEDGETLRPDWPIHGSTGYDFMNQASHVFIVPEHEHDMVSFYRTLNTYPNDPTDLLYECKAFVIEEFFGGEMDRLTRRLRPLLPPPWPREDAVRGALTAAIAAFPVYRSYITGKPLDPEDRSHVDLAIHEAQRRAPDHHDLLEQMRRVLTLSGEAGDSGDAVRFVAAFQQLTGPVMAKGMEDTALYRYFPLISLNTVGGGPTHFGQTVEAFHAANLRRRETHPFSLLASSTHDTKRSEDVRARINTLSEVPDLWISTVKRWMSMNAPHRRRVRGAPVPDPNEEYLLYQTLVGAWPLGGTAGPGWAEFPERMHAYAEKALREAKVHTSWTMPRPEYEEAVSAFLTSLLDTSGKNPFPADVERFLEPVVRAGFYNALGRTVLKIASPGVPDFYQGTELWDFSLVDPDNRRPVDFRPRGKMLQELDKRATKHRDALTDELMATPEDGRIKLYITSQMLRLRRAHRDLFTTGAYVPLTTDGLARNHALAFARTEDERRMVAVVSRFHLMLAGRQRPVGDAWHDTALCLPAEWSGARFRDLFTGLKHIPAPHGDGARLPLADVFRHMPVALLERIP
jgi:(1->4)-alpha-D-glucan 1-alpha-D-glucosylmutase